MNKELNYHSLYPGKENNSNKEQVSSISALINKERNLLRETQNNFTSLISNLKKSSVKTTPILTSKDKVVKVYQTEERKTHTGKSTIISELTNRLNYLELQLNIYQTKANNVKDSIQKSLTPMKNKVIVMTNKQVQNKTILTLNDRENNDYYKQLLYNRKETNQESLSNIKSYNYNLTEDNNNKKGINIINDPTISFTTINNNNNNNYNVELKTNLFQLLSQIVSLKETNRIAKEDIQISKSEFQSQLFETQSQLIGKFNKEKDKLIKSSLNQTNALKEELNEKSIQIETMQNEISNLNKTNKELLLSLTESNLQRDQYLIEITTKLTPQVTSLILQNKELEKTLKSTKEQYESNYLTHKNQIQELETQMLKQKDEVNLIAQDYLNNKNDLDHFREMNDKLTKDIEAINKKYDNMKPQSNTLNQQIKAKDKMILTLTNRTNALKEIIEENELKHKKEMSIIMKDLKEYKTKHEVLSKKMSMIASENHSHSNHKTHTEEEYVNMKKEYEREVMRLNDLISDHKIENEEYLNEKILLNEEIEIYKQNLQKERLNSEEMNNKYELNNEENFNKIIELKKMIEEMKINPDFSSQNKSDQFEKEKYELKIKELNETIVKCNDNNEDHKEKYALLSLQLSQAMNKKEENDHSYQEKINSLESKLKEVNDEYSKESIMLNDELNYYKKINVELNEENSKCNDVIKMGNNQIEKDSFQIKSLELSVNKLTTEKAILFNDMNIIKCELDQLKQDNELKENEYIEIINELEGNARLLIGQNDEKNKEIDKLKEVILNKEELKKINDQLKHSIDLLEKEYNAFKENTVINEEYIKEKDRQQCKELQSELNTEKENIRKKQKEVDNLFNNVINYKQQVESLSNANQLLMNEVNNLKCKLYGNVTIQNSESINKILNILLDESTSIEERNRIKQLLLKYINNTNNNMLIENEVKDNSNNKDEEEDEDEEDDDDGFQIDEEEIEEINKIPGQRNSTMQKKGYSTYLLK